ncbi:MAG TPA: hypothetical protein VME92_08965 [Acetobacteraceae bacterium]|nr:hypothetical protein [Acetobacteraceae bacterium]
METRLDEILAGVSISPVSGRAAYLDCLARCRPPGDVEADRDRCRMLFLAALAGAGLGSSSLSDLEQRLEALEAEISEET